MTSFDFAGRVVTEVEVASLIFGLEEASPCLGVNVCSLLHQELHILLTASLDGNVEGRLT